MGPRLHYPGQLQDGQIIAAVLSMPQSLVEGFYILALDLQLSGFALDLIQVVIRQVVFRL